MTYTFRPRGVCSQEMRVEVDDAGIIQKMEVLGGCSGKAPPYHLQTSLLGLKGGKGIAAVGLTLHKKGLHQMMPGLTVCPFHGNHSLF